MSSSPLVFGSIANAITGAGSRSVGILIGSSRAASQSPARVSLSFATPPMSPGPNSSAVPVALPANIISWPIRSLEWVRVFSSELSWASVPWKTRSRLMRPANGSARVLKT